jgi:translocation and assembly module TamB
MDSISLTTTLSNFNLSFLQPMLPELHNIGGNVNSRAVISGQLKNPDIRGDFSISHLKFKQDYIEAPVTDGIISVKFMKDRLFIDTLKLDIADGYLSMFGDVEFDSMSVTRFNINSVLNNIEFDIPEIANIMLANGKLSLTTKNKTHLLQGRIYTGDSKYYRDLKIDDLWGALVSKSKKDYSDNADEDIDFLSLYEKKIKTNGAAIPKFLKDTKINISLENRDDFWVDNNVADFFILFNLTLSGEALSPALTGRVKIKENGQINFLDRVFDIRKGSIEFDNLERINPIINISAETEINIPETDNRKEKTYLITLVLDGTLNQMTTSLTSQPSMEPADIVSLLTLGMTYNEFTSVSTNNESSEALKKRSGEIAGQLINYKMNSYLKKILGDQGNSINLELQGDIFDMDDTRLAVNKRWGKKVTISYSTSMKDFDNRIIRIEYKINDEFSVQGETGQDQESAIDFKYKIRFK